MYIITGVHKASHLLKTTLLFIPNIYNLFVFVHQKWQAIERCTQTLTHKPQIVLYILLYEMKIALMVQCDWPTFFILLLQLLLLCTC